jgi:Flp pilus assembly protein TadD
MTIKILAKLALCVLLAVGPTAATSVAAESLPAAQVAKKAAKLAAHAQKALARRDAAKAIVAAEGAVALEGGDAGYRALLGNAYLRGGRFASAEQAFGDVLTLQPDNGRVALGLALAQIGTGHWDAARATLERHAGGIAAADRGLALALAGDPTGAVELLIAATRSPDANAKTRQNLALAMALAGRWQEARSLLGMDLTPVEADARIVQWASFAQPQSATDQVASLLGVTPAVDPGQPVAIALNGTVPVAPVQTSAADVDDFMPGQPDESQERVALAPAAMPDPVVPAKVQRVAAPRAPSVTPQRVRTAAVRRATGGWAVQIGAFANAAVARQGWLRAVRREPALAGRTPVATSAAVKGATFYRLAVAGLAKNDAVALCRRYRVKGGSCFVRVQGGERVAAWHRRGVQLAAR